MEDTDTKKCKDEIKIHHGWRFSSSGRGFRRGEYDFHGSRSRTKDKIFIWPDLSVIHDVDMMFLTRVNIFGVHHESNKVHFKFHWRWLRKENESNVERERPQICIQVSTPRVLLDYSRLSKCLLRYTEKGYVYGTKI